MKTWNIRHWLLALVALFLVGCKPIASFIYSPSTVTVGQEVTFDASASSGKFPIVTYNWNLGNNVNKSGKVVKHTFTTAGTYTVKLTVTDNKGQFGTSEQTVVVKPPVAPPATGSAEIAVQSSDNTLVGNATLKIGDKTAQTDVNGKATITGLNLQQALVVQVTREGYINQSVRIEAQAANTTTARALVVLKPVKEVKDLPQIQLPQVIPASTLGATITIPENAFVTPNGQVATGAAKVQLTPWDITNNDMAAMPGGGVARDANGALVNLISAGMITAEFYDAQGQKLQLASGKQATIQMNLPKTSIGGNALSVGSTIPLWHFDEAQGLWLQEGNGTVVAATNTTGLAVQATVSHFSTWHWSNISSGLWQNSMQISCVKNSALVPCDVTAQITLTDGTVTYKSTSLPAAVSDIKYMPSTATIKWYVWGELVATTPVGGTVVLQVPEIYSAFVRCQLPNNIYTSCITDNGYFVPAEGATINRAKTQSYIQTISAISNWVSTSATTFSRYSGSLTFTINNTGVTNIAIPLISIENLSGEIKLYTCDPIVDTQTFGYPNVITISNCLIKKVNANTLQPTVQAIVITPGQYISKEPNELISAQSFTPECRMGGVDSCSGTETESRPHPSISNTYIIKLRFYAV